MSNKAKDSAASTGLGIADVLLGGGIGALTYYLTKKKYKNLIDGAKLQEEITANPTKFKTIPYESLPKKTSLTHNENINADIRDGLAKGEKTKDDIALETFKNRKHLFAHGSQLVDEKATSGKNAFTHAFPRELVNIPPDVTPIMPQAGYKKTFGALNSDQLLAYKGGMQDYMDEQYRAIMQSGLGITPNEYAHYKDMHTQNMKNYELTKKIIGDAAGAPPDNLETFLAKTINEQHKQLYPTDIPFNAADMSMQDSPIYGKGYSYYEQPVIDAEALKKVQDAIKSAYSGGSIPRYEDGGFAPRRFAQNGYRVPQFAGGGVPGMQQAMTANMARAANVGGQYQQEIMRELMGEGRDTEHPVDYRTRMMMESFVGRDPANPTMGSSAEQAQAQAQQSATMSQNGVSDPTGQLFQGQGAEMDPLQMQQQQQMNDAMRSKIPYYQHAYQKALQHSQNPKGAMRNIVSPKTRT